MKSTQSMSAAELLPSDPSPAQLVGWVLDVQGIGPCAVLRVAPKLPGATTHHLLQLPNGRQTKIALERHGNGRRPFRPLHRVGEEPGRAAADGGAGAGAAAATADRAALLEPRGGGLETPRPAGGGGDGGIERVERNLGAAKASMAAAIAQAIETGEDLTTVHGKAKKLKKAALKFRELGLLQNRMMRHANQSGICRALTHKHDVLGICFVDDDDGFTRARRMWFLFMLIIMTAGVTLAVAAYADEHSDDDTCGDWCQIGIIMVVTTVFKMLAHVLLARVLPNTKERSVIERKRTSKCMRTTRWVVGSILLLGLLLSGFIVLVLGILRENATAGLLGVQSTLKLYFSSLLLNQVYDLAQIVVWYWVWDRRCGTRIDPELRDIQERHRRLEQESIASSINDSMLEEGTSDFAYAYAQAS